MIEHGDKLYKIHGRLEEEFKQKPKPNFRYNGETIVEFKDGDKYSITRPLMVVDDTKYMTYQEYIKIDQLNSNLRSVVFMGNNKEEEGNLAISGIIYVPEQSKTFNTKAKQTKDLKDIDEIIWEIEGFWTNNCIIDGKKYWDIKQSVITPHIPVTNPLPSDSRYREDLVWLWKGDNIDYAQNWKTALEECQRYDKKLRGKR